MTMATFFSIFNLFLAAAFAALFRLVPLCYRWLFCPELSVIFIFSQWTYGFKRIELRDFFKWK
jgi:hypothetical protein